MAEKSEAKTVDQIGIVVKDIDKVIAIWSSLFGIGSWVFRDIDDIDTEGHPIKVRRAFGNLGPMQFELMQPVEGRTRVSEFLDTHGEGVHHLCFFVDDLETEVAQLVEQGAKVLETVKGRFAHVDTGGPGGVIFELLSRRRVSELLG